MLRIVCLFLCFAQLYCVSPNGDVVGKLAVGYQGWFSAKDDNSPRHSWFHWAANEIPRASRGHFSFENWPDVREYTHTYQSGFAHLGNGQPAKLFSSYDDQSVDTHFKWMQENGIDVAAVQRFGAGLKSPTEGPFINGVANKVRASAEKFGRKFYIMWDITDWQGYHQEIKDDWTNTVSKWIKSSAYAHQNGKPVVCIWGLPFNERPGDANQALDLINFFKSKGVYVIGGVTRLWRTGADCKKDFQKVFNAMDMIQPWTVGGYSDMPGAKDYQKNLRDDFAYCNQHNIDYQPVLFPGSGWSNTHPAKRNEIKRLHGDFLWQQFVNLREINIPSAYIAMFDEYDEGTAIAKTAESKDWAPTDQWFYTLDADGVHLSSDFYLRLAHDGAKMMKKEIGLTQQHPTKHVL